MDKLYKYWRQTIGLLSISLGAVACNGDDATPLSYIDIQVQLSVPSIPSATGEALANRLVTITDVDGQQFTALTNSDGIATFSGQIPSIYSLATSWDMTGAQYTALTNEQVGGTEYVFSGTGSAQPFVSSRLVPLEVSASARSILVISKVYYSQGKDNANRNYMTGTYVELFNNSDADVNLEGYYLALNESNSTIPQVFAGRKETDQFAKQVYKFPAYVVPVGGTVVITNVAINHKATASNEPDLSRADFEVLDPTGRVANQASVADLEQVYSSLSNLNMNLLFNGPTSLFLMKTSENPANWPRLGRNGTTSESATNTFLTIPTSTIVDGVDILTNRTNGGVDPLQKRFPTFIDAGYTYVSATRSSIVVARKVKQTTPRVILEDTNNSTNDFIQVTALSPRDFSYTSTNN